MKACVCVCMLKMYPAMISGDNISMCVCVRVGIYPAMVSGDHKGDCVCVCVCVEYVSSDAIWRS